MSESAQEAFTRGRGPLRRLLARLGLLGSPPAGYAYHGFISYSHAADGKLAPALQRGLQRFAKAWYQARALRIFRDDASMSVNANLWRSIEQALDDSEHYILLASPESASSEWVAREAERWQRTKPPEKLLVALTAGELVWDARSGDFDWERTDALPRVLAGAFEDQPRFVDLRWAREETDLSLEQPRFLEAIADLAAPLHGRPKDELASEEVVQQRRAVRVRRVVAAGLVTITALAVLAGVVALIQRRSAIRSERAAESQLLASKSLSTGDLQQAGLLAIEAYRLAPTFDARTALLSVAQSHQLGTPFGDGTPVYDAVVSPDERTLATGGADGRVRTWDLRTHRRLWEVGYGAGAGAVRALAFSPDGRELAFSQRGSVVVVDVRRHARLVSTAGAGGGSAGGRINGLAFSPRGDRLASAGSDRAVRLWDVRAATRGRAHTVTVLRGHSGPVNAVAFSPDGRTVASSSCDASGHTDTGDHSVLLWDVGTGQLQARFAGANPVCGIALSPDGKLLAAAGDDGAVALWDVARRRTAGLPLVGHTDALSAVTFSPDGKLLASASRDHTVRIWELSSRREAYAPLKQTQPVSSVSFSPDGRMLATAGADGARVWSVWSPDELGELPAGVASPRGVGFSRDGRLLAWTDASVVADARMSASAVPSGRHVWIWDVATRRQVARAAGDVVGESGPAAVSRDGRMLAFAPRAGGVELWDLVSRRALGLLASPGSARIETLAFSRDGSELASGAADGAVRLWDVRRRGQLGAPLVGHAGAVLSVAFSGDGRLLASGGADDTIRLWDVGRHRARGGPLMGHTGSVFSLAFSPDGRSLASASRDGFILLWDVAARRELLRLPGHSGLAYGVAFSPAGSVLASTGSDGAVRLWGRFSIADALARLCTQIDPAAAPRLWHELEPTIAYRRPC